jgi:hypothetical protein
MDYDRDKVDEMVLALLWLTLGGDGRAWKGHDWDAGCPTLVLLLDKGGKNQSQVAVVFACHSRKEICFWRVAHV